MGGVLGKADVAGGEARQLGQLLGEALAADPVLDGALAPDVSGSALHLSVAPGAEVHLRREVDVDPTWCHLPSNFSNRWCSFRQVPTLKLKNSILRGEMDAHLACVCPIANAVNDPGVAGDSIP